MFRAGAVALGDQSSADYTTLLPTHFRAHNLFYLTFLLNEVHKIKKIHFNPPIHTIFHRQLINTSVIEAEHCHDDGRVEAAIIASPHLGKLQLPLLFSINRPYPRFNVYFQFNTAIDPKVPASFFISEYSYLNRLLSARNARLILTRPSDLGITTCTSQMSPGVPFNKHHSSDI